MLTEAEDLKGWLQKKGDKGFIKSYKSRYFQQIDAKLFYFEDPADKEPLGSIDLSHCVIGKKAFSVFDIIRATRTTTQRWLGI